MSQLDLWGMSIVFMLGFIARDTWVLRREVHKLYLDSLKQPR